MASEVGDDSAVTLLHGDLSAMSKNERIKVESEGLFYVADKKGPHPFGAEVAALTAGDEKTLSATAKELSKFFGIYRQQARGERGKKLDDHFMMVRIKLPAGGRLSAAQWLALDAAADAHADGTLRITSRQGIQYHRIYGPSLAPLMRDLNRGYRDHGTLGACGDVNRNVMASPIDDLDPNHAPGGTELAEQIATELSPRSSAYFQIFLSDENGKAGTPVNPEEPIYGKQYLPRKFKIGLAHPEDNSSDVLTQDVGLVPVCVDGRADGSLWDLYSGGGLGMTHNNPKTAPHLGLYLGRIRRDQVVGAVRGIVFLQKENGDRKDRKQARWKYTIRRLGLDVVKAALRERFEIDLEDTEPQALAPMQLHLGWHEQRGGGGYYGISVENGRVKPELRKAVREAVTELDLSVKLTAQQDLVLCDVADREALLRILDAHGVPRAESVGVARANAMACPAKPTCGLAMTDAENILPLYFDAIEEAGLGDVDVVIRMTGCPNNCARPPSAEIGIFGYGKNDHVILVGGSREGSRLAQPLYGRVAGEQMIPVLIGLFGAIREHNSEDLPVGDFLHQTDPAQLRAWIGVEDRA